MAISWGDALLAGAGGVAEYSNDKQKQKQKRIDKLQDMQNNMRMEQAKSAYAVKLNQHSKDSVVHKRLSSVAKGSYAEQIILAQQQGMGHEAAEQHAELALSGASAMLGRPTDSSPPKFQMPTLGESKTATSPLYDWIKGYRDVPSNKEEVPATPTVPPETTTTSSIPERTQEQQAAEVEAIRERNKPDPNWHTDKTTVIVDGKEVVKLTTIDRNNPEGSVQEEFIETNKAIKENVTSPSWHTDKTTVIVDGKEVVKLTTIDRNNPEGAVQEEFIKTNKSSKQRVTPITSTNEVGETISTERFYNPETDKVESGDVFKINSGDPEEPIEQIDLQTISRFMDKGNPKTGKPAGQFFAKFSKTEQENWGALKGGEKAFWFWNSDEGPEGFGQAIGEAFLNAKAQLLGAKWIKAKHLSSPIVMSEIDQMSKANAYLNLLGVQGIKEAVEAGAVDKGLFYGPSTNRMKAFKQIQRALGIEKGHSEFVNLSSTTVQF